MRKILTILRLSEEFNMKLKVKRRDMGELMKALSGEEDEELEYFKTKILEHLDKLEKHEHNS
jgi:hypothetical protein